MMEASWYIQFLVAIFVLKMAATWDQYCKKEYKQRVHNKLNFSWKDGRRRKVIFDKLRKLIDFGSFFVIQYFK